MKLVDRRLFNSDERKQLLEKTSYKCAHCGKKLTVESATVEHIQPISRGGDNSEFNTTVLCKQCNNNKSNAIYPLEDYYKYIKEEYLYRYREKTSILRMNYARTSNKYDILQYDARLYQYIPTRFYDMLANQYARNKSKVKKLINNLAVKIKLEKAYPADAEDILEYVTKIEEKFGYSKCIYDNIYSILDTIQYGQAIIAKKSDNSICGVFMFNRFRENKNSLVQIDTVEKYTKLKASFIMTYAFCSLNDLMIFETMMNDIQLSMMEIGILPIYFNIISDHYNLYNEYISIPYEINKIKGNLELFTLKNMKKMLYRAYESRYLIIGENNRSSLANSIDLFVHSDINIQHISLPEDLDEFNKNFENSIIISSFENIDVDNTWFNELKIEMLIDKNECQWLKFYIGIQN